MANTTNVPKSLEYPDHSIFETLRLTASRNMKEDAYEFFGARVSYSDFLKQIETAAAAMHKMGVRRGDRVTICMPNCPQGIIMIYAVNRLGAIANMVHPLSAQEEIAFCVTHSESRVAITLDQFYPKFAAVADKTQLQALIITSVADAMPLVTKAGYKLTKGRKVAAVPNEDPVVFWKDFLKSGASAKLPAETGKGDDPAVILYSGGTTGKSKGIVHCNRSINASAMQTVAAGDCTAPKDKMLSIMPIFHGFGLGVCIHTVYTYGGCCILVPQFTPRSCVKLLKKYKPAFIVGVPTLYEAMTRIEGAEDLDLSCLKGVFCGGDNLTPPMKEKIDAFLKKRGSSEQVREGYGMTECVGVSCLTPRYEHKVGSIGTPLPNMQFKIVMPATQMEVPAGQIGEMCVSGPTVMLGYLNNPGETARTLQVHEDGNLWLHTGDLGYMDEEGYIFYTQRLKRMIISSGYNVYPSQIEEVVNAFPGVLMSTAVGVKDDYKMQKVKVFVVLQKGVEASDKLKNDLWEHCRRNIARYAMPAEIEFRTELPRTLLGKVAYTQLQDQ